MAHCGLTGFSTQKLTWGSAVGVPFDIGVWHGVDGSEVVAALNPGAYDNDLTTDVSRDLDRRGGRRRAPRPPAGRPGAMKYYGTGDVGGAPERSVGRRCCEQSLAADGPVKVISAGADQLFRDLTPAQVAGLPRYDGELLMTSHGAGCYTSQAAMKRWNRHNEVLADAAERAAALAWWLGAQGLPAGGAGPRLDPLPVAPVPRRPHRHQHPRGLHLHLERRAAHASRSSARCSTDAVARWRAGWTPASQGEPIVVYNPLALARTDLVTLAGDGAVFDGAGQPVRAQVADGRLTFAATVPANGFAVFDHRASGDGRRHPARSPPAPTRGTPRRACSRTPATACT